MLVMFIRPEFPQFFPLGTPKKFDVCFSGGYCRGIAAAYSK
jgi:hypothetical protein